MNLALSNNKVLPSKVHVVLILLCGLAVYFNSLNGPFLFDDSVVIVNEPNIHNFQLNWSSGRLITDFTYALNYYFHDLDTTGYHIINLLLHLINGLLVYSLTILLFRTPWLSNTDLCKKSKEIAFLAAILFVVHPIQTQAVSYIAQRYTAMAALFYLAAICLYILFRQNSHKDGIKKYIPYVGFLFCVLLAFKSKQNAATLPIAIILIETFFYSEKLKKRLLYLSPFIFGLIAILAYLLISGISLEEISAKTRLDTMMPRYDYLLTQFLVIVTYIRLLILPINQNLDYDYPISNSLLHPEVFASFLLHATILAFAGYCLLKSKEKKQLRLFSFGIFWFYLTLSVESSIIPIVDVIYEHRGYLPSVGFFIMIATVFHMISPFNKNNIIRITVITILVLALGIATINRNEVWQSSFALWNDTAHKSPNKARPLNNLGTEYFKSGDYDKALEYYLLAISKDRRYMKAYFNAGEVNQKTGNYQQALIYFRIFVTAWPDYPETHKNLAEIYQILGQKENAGYHLKTYENLKGGWLHPRYR